MILRQTHSLRESPRLHISASTEPAPSSAPRLHHCAVLSGFRITLPSSCQVYLHSDMQQSSGMKHKVEAMPSEMDTLACMHACVRWRSSRHCMALEFLCARSDDCCSPGYHWHSEREDKAPQTRTFSLQVGVRMLGLTAEGKVSRNSSRTAFCSASSSGDCVRSAASQISATNASHAAVSHRSIWIRALYPATCHDFY